MSFWLSSITAEKTRSARLVGYTTACYHHFVFGNLSEVI